MLTTKNQNLNLDAFLHSIVKVLILIGLRYNFLINFIMKPKYVTFLIDLSVIQVFGIFLDRFMTDHDKNCLLFFHNIFVYFLIS
jgi:hypothetical protein